MAYDKLGILNLAVTRLGVRRLTALTDTSKQADDALAVWEYVLKEVLSEKDWRFAKTRAKLAQAGEDDETENTYNWDHAYQLPDGFIRLAYEDPDDPVVYPATAAPYKIEIVRATDVIEGEDDVLCLLTDYEATDDDPIYVTFIKYEEDCTLYSPKFVNALAFRLAAELAIPLTEGDKKYANMMTLYEKALEGADALNQSMDYVEGETGNTDWETAGR